MIANLENRAVIHILLAATVSFLWLLAPFDSAIFWVSIIAILFSPLEKRLQVKLKGRKTLSALLTTLGTLLLVVIPLVLVLILLGFEAVNFYQRFNDGDFSIQPYLDGIQSTFPSLELGGISMFGLNGFVMGTVLAALFLVICQLFMEEYLP